jgi:hypothetical protein
MGHESRIELLLKIHKMVMDVAIALKVKEI